MSNQVYSNSSNLYNIQLVPTQLSLIITGLNNTNNLPISLSYTKVGNTICLSITSISGSFGTPISFLQIQTLPAFIRPSRQKTIPVVVTANNLAVMAQMIIGTDGNVNFFLFSGNWPSSTTNGLPHMDVYYNLVI
jgi:hypothetical protein